MLQYVLTALAGVALGVVAMRLLQARQASPPAEPGEAQDDGAAAAPATSSRNLLLGAGGLVVLALAVFLLRSPEESESAGMSPANAASGAANSDLPDVDTMIDRLAKRLEANPDDGEGYRMLGWSYVMTGKPQLAIEPYKRALKLQPERAVVHTGYGEALVGIAGDKVTPEAKGYFTKALSLDPSEPRARYFMGLWKAQNGQEKQALEDWIALSNDGPGDAPWQGDVHRRIGEVSAKLGIDVSKRLKFPAPPAELPVVDRATVDAASRLPESDREEMVDGMVEGLAAKLKANPANADGWVMLLRSRMVRKETGKAGEDLKAARKALADDPPGLRRVDAAARELGVPGA